MIAKEDITEGSTLDLSKWEVDETAMRFRMYDSSKSYMKGYYAYIYNNTLFGPVFALIRATENISADTPFDPTQWEVIESEIPMKDIFYPVVVSVIYDIGVM
jgi:hypothetical protein